MFQIFASDPVGVSLDFISIEAKNRNLLFSSVDNKSPSTKSEKEILLAG